MSTEQQTFITMLTSARVPHMIVEDMNDPDQRTVTIENLMVDRDTRIDVVFQFRRGALDRVWARRG